MKAKDISKKINSLDCEKYSEASLRESVQSLMLLIGNCDVGESEKEELLKPLRVKIRNNLFRSEPRPPLQNSEMNSLLEEICLAADFYLLESERRINLFPSNENTYVSLDIRAFENLFYRIARILFERNSEISVFVKSSAHFCSLVFRAENDTDIFPENGSGIFYLYENGRKSPCIKTRKCADSPDLPVDEDFSVLLYDRMSPLHVWLCDI